MRINANITESDLDNDFEYNFDLNPYNLLLNAIHRLVTTPFHMGKWLIDVASSRLLEIHKNQNYRRTFKGPVCMLK